MQTWQQWIYLNKHKMKHPVDFEERFAIEILTKIKEITPNDVIPQYHFIDFVSSQSTMHRISKFDLDGGAFNKYVDRGIIYLLKRLQTEYNENPTPEKYLQLVIKKIITNK